MDITDYFDVDDDKNEKCSLTIQDRPLTIGSLSKLIITAKTKENTDKSKHSLLSIIFKNVYVSGSVNSKNNTAFRLLGDENVSFES